MKIKNANAVREIWTAKLLEFLQSEGEDVGQIATNSINFPVVQDDEEGWVEIKIIVPKVDEGYEKREEFTYKLEEKVEAEKRKTEEKKKKIERDQKRREEMKKKKEEGEE